VFRSKWLVNLTKRHLARAAGQIVQAARLKLDAATLEVLDRASAQKRSARKGLRSICGDSPATSSAMLRAVAAALHMPMWPLPGDRAFYGEGLQTSHGVALGRKWGSNRARARGTEQIAGTGDRVIHY